jgi:hypothetical protein
MDGGNWQESADALALRQAFNIAVKYLKPDQSRSEDVLKRLSRTILKVAQQRPNLLAFELAHAAFAKLIADSSPN